MTLSERLKAAGGEVADRLAASPTYSFLDGWSDGRAQLLEELGLGDEQSGVVVVRNRDLFVTYGLDPDEAPLTVTESTDLDQRAVEPTTVAVHVEGNARRVARTLTAITRPQKGQTNG